MKPHAPIVSLMMVVPVYSVLGQPSASREETSPIADVLLMLRTGVPSEAIRVYVETQKLYFRLSAEEVVALTQAGAEAGLLVFLLDRGRLIGSPMPIDGVEILYEGEGFRAFRKIEAGGKEVIVLTNIDENGRRMDQPLEIAEQVPPPPEEHTARGLPGEEPPPGEFSVQVEPESAPPPPPPRSRPQPRRGMIYVGPFTQFIPSNLPGPGSPWSPVFQVVPVYWGSFPFGISVHPFFHLSPVFAPVLPLYGFSP